MKKGSLEKGKKKVIMLGIITEESKTFFLNFKTGNIAEQIKFGQKKGC